MSVLSRRKYAAKLAFAGAACVGLLGALASKHGAATAEGHRVHWPRTSL